MNAIGARLDIYNGSFRNFNIALIDHHLLFRQCLRTVLQPHGIAVTMEGERQAMVAALLNKDIESLDLILIAQIMPGLDGIDLTRQLREFKIAVPILVVGDHEYPEYAAEALAAGANGYILKRQSALDFVEAITLLACRPASRYLPPTMPADEVDQLLTTDETIHARLTEPERQVSLLVVNGLTYRKIGLAMQRSHKTIETHICNIFTKLDIHSKVELAYYVARKGWGDAKLDVCN